MRDKEGLTMPEKNEGYEIIAREVYSTSRLGQQDSIVLGRNETKYGTMYVTWGKHRLAAERWQHEI